MLGLSTGESFFFISPYFQKRKRQPVPVFLPRKSRGQRSLTGCSSCSGKGVEHDLNDWARVHACVCTHTHTYTPYFALWKEAAVHYPYFCWRQLYYTSLMVECLCKLLEILLHERFLCFPSSVYLFNHFFILIWVDENLFYNSGYNPIQLYHLLVSCHSFGLWEILRLASVPLWCTLTNFDYV